LLDEKDYRVILSGSGGDEVLGGVPTPLPELAGYLTHFQFSKLLEQGLKWSLIDRSPFLFLLLSTTWFTAALYISAIRRSGDTPPWISKRLHASAARKWQMPHARPTFGLSPNVLSNGLAWFPMLDSLPHLSPRLLRKFEYRYPYLDRDLITFIFGIPRDQLVRPGNRRSLMRRALKQIVPTPVLERRRKAYPSRGLLLASQLAGHHLASDPLVSRYGLVEPTQLKRAFSAAASELNVQLWKPLRRTLLLELWLQSNGLVVGPLETS
jgi:asparagine synthase (glutamine-hydrolysing)